MKRIRIKPVAAIAVLLAVMPAAARQQQRPEPPPLERVEFPPYETRTLDNGLQVFALEHNEQPVLSIQLILRAGAADDPARLPGLATFTTDMLDTGTTTRTAQQIAEAIDATGGDISAEASRESITVSATVLKDSVDVAFELLTDIVMQPAFRPDEIERLRQQVRSGLAADLQDPDFIADAVFNLALYGDHPYAHPAGGTPSSIQRIDREAMVDFHSRHFAPDRAALVVAGALPPDEVFTLAEKWFGDWEKQGAPALEPGDPGEPERRRILIIDDPSSVQTEIRIGQTTVARNAPDYFPVLVATYVLGGPEGRLMESLREQRGLTYGAYEAIAPRRGAGALYATTETRTDKTLEAVELIFDEIERLRSEPVPEDELEAVKAFLIGSFPLTIETPADLAARLANLFIYDLGADYLETYRDKLAAITAADVARVARERVRDEDVIMVLLGRAEDFREELEGMGSVEVLPLSELDLDSPELRTPGR